MRGKTLFTIGTLIALIVLPPISPSLHGEETFAPFISKLEARVQENSVVLSWKDSSASIHHYEIYRSTQKISKRTFSEAKLVARVYEGIEAFIDYPPTTDPYYYAVLAAGEDGTLYELFIPYRNITVSSSRVAYTSSAEARASEITSIEAYVRDDTVVVEFDRSKPDRPVIVYRSTSPLRSVDDLVDAQALSTISSSENRITDYPLPGISYYYAVFDSQLAKSGSYTFEVGSNTTGDAVEVPLDQSSISRIDSRSKRSTPLPYLYLSESILTGEELGRPASSLSHIREPKALSPETIKIFDTLLRRAPEQERRSPSPQILPVDKNPSGTGADYRLAQIVKSGFESRDWNALVEELHKFLRIDHTRSREKRARFYLAQSYFFRRQYRKAFLEFTLSREEYRMESDSWLTLLYERMDG